MDAFKYTVMLEALEKNPMQIPLDSFEEALLTFSREDLDEIFVLLNTDKSHAVDEANHIMQMLQAIWHYR